MTDESHVPKGVSLDTLREIIAGWAAAGAAGEPQYTTEVEDITGISDAVGRQTRFLEDLGILEPVGQKHRLTDAGKDLAGALVVDEEERARERARELLADWPLTQTVRGIVRENPTPEDDLVPLAAVAAGQDPDSSRVRSGVSTLLEFLDWADLLDRDEAGRYRLSEPETEASGIEAGEESEAEPRELETEATEAVEEIEREPREPETGATEAVEQAGAEPREPSPGVEQAIERAEEGVGAATEAPGAEAGTAAEDLDVEPSVEPDVEVATGVDPGESETAEGATKEGIEDAADGAPEAEAKPGVEVEVGDTDVEIDVGDSEIDIQVEGETDVEAGATNGGDDEAQDGQGEEKAEPDDLESDGGVDLPDSELRTDGGDPDESEEETGDIQVGDSDAGATITVETEPEVTIEVSSQEGAETEALEQTEGATEEAVEQTEEATEEAGEAAEAEETTEEAEEEESETEAAEEVEEEEEAEEVAEEAAEEVDEEASEEVTEEAEEATEEAEEATGEAEEETGEAEEETGEAEETVEEAEEATEGTGEAEEATQEETEALEKDIEEQVQAALEGENVDEMLAELGTELAAEATADGESSDRPETSRPGTDAVALSLDLNLDAEPEQIEAIVRGIRRGLTEES